MVQSMKNTWNKNTANAKAQTGKWADITSTFILLVLFSTQNQ